MTTPLRDAADTILNDAVYRAGGVPGVVAMATDRESTFYEGAAGVRELGGGEAMTADSVMLIASCTKAITGAAVMQMAEEGLVNLDDPARKYVPEINNIKVLEGFSPDGEAQLRDPATPVTLNQLMLHTAGFGYEFFSDDLLRYRTDNDIPSILSCTKAGMMDVMLHDPGARWTYGSSIEWLGLVVEAVRGQRLGDVLAERVFAPLGMQETAFEMTPAMLARRATVHQRAADGQITPLPEMVLPQPAEVQLGGAALYGTVGDYLKFIRMILNDGDGPHGRVLQPATVEQMAQNGLGDIKTQGWETSIPALANSGDFFPGLSKSWSYTFQVNDEPAPTGRPAGQLSWAGLANSFYWIDRQNGIGGMWSSQILPFLDVASYPAYVEFESAVYRALRPSA